MVDHKIAHRFSCLRSTGRAQRHRKINSILILDKAFFFANILSSLPIDDGVKANDITLIRCSHDLNLI